MLVMTKTINIDNCVSFCYHIPMVPTSGEHLRPYNFGSDLFDDNGHLIGGPLKTNDPRTDPPFNGWATNIPPIPTSKFDENENHLIDTQNSLS